MENLFWAINLFLFLNPTEAEVPVFLTNEKAHNILTRQRRENSFWEEVKEGNLERECIEERCSYEEAREIFEDDQQTDEYWNKYADGDQCESSPCRNHGQCRDGLNRYECICNPGFRGINCEIDIPKLCNWDNGGCHHYCRVQRERVRCSCVEGYRLGSDDKSCLPQVPHPCGTINTERARGLTIDSEPESTNSTATNDTDEQPSNPNSNTPNVRIVGGQDCPLGQCPWQVLLVDEVGKGFCGGTILTELLVLTAAHCLNQTKAITAVFGEFDIKKDENTEQRQDVVAAVAHHKFVEKTYDNDIAVLLLKNPVEFNENIVPICLPQREFAETVLMKMPNALISGWGRVLDQGMTADKLQRLTVPYIDRTECIESSKYPVSQNMFCAGYKDENQDACQGDSGGPHVTQHKNTWFVTGIVSWGEGCAQKGKYGIYTKVSKYIRWLKMVMKQFHSNRNASSFN
ncbi:coagulation factor X-like [Heterodontus francisci]|uniref:coagulation factor X-like n=1 Tax=Heterodontus francisci TaxID=7792 RepID=UPI00355B276E